MNKIDTSNLGNVVIFRPKGENATLEVYLKEETVWLTQAQMTELFQTERSVITKHIRNILQSKELRKNSVCAFFAHTAQDGKIYKTQFYNLDMIISVAYRVNSKRGVRFRGLVSDHLVGDMGEAANKGVDGCAGIDEHRELQRGPVPALVKFNGRDFSDVDTFGAAPIVLQI